jgi:hypothetical protein
MPACIQAVLRRRGIKETQNSIAKEVNCSSDNNGCVFNSQLSEFFSRRNLSFDFFWYNEIPGNDIDIILEDYFKKDYDIILGTLISKSRDLKHTCLIEDIKRNQLTLLDPKDNLISYVNLEKIYSKMWQDKIGGFGLISDG